MIYVTPIHFSQFCLPVQLNPFPLYPDKQQQSNEPIVLLHSALE